VIKIKEIAERYYVSKLPCDLLGYGAFGKVWRGRELG
jgi:hypothetical protein